ncbi:hypothetical protein VTN31DRAFT_7218 [Thermomyces dupontii]|uniref:uncharacterized protein n=1 Tax=Talaromyces thermophilus TaxID=28565 RepID=UPI00374429BE
MPDYTKWKVVDLKAELKRRGIPQTGLRLKQEFIDKLVELDAEAEKASTPAQESKEPDPAEQDASKTQGREPEVEDDARNEGKETEVANADARSEVTLSEEEKEDAGQERTGANAPEQEVGAKPEPEKKGDSGKENAGTIAAERELDAGQVAVEDTIQRKEDAEDLSEPTEPEKVDDTLKRKRRSGSPAPSAETIKKARTENHDPRVVMKEDVGEDASELIEKPIAAAEGESHGEFAKPESQPAGAEEEQKDKQEPPQDKERTTPPVQARPDARFNELRQPAQKRQRVPTPVQTPAEENRSVEPALHPATRAIYVRNLMRPLQPAILKDFLISIASCNGDPAESDLLSDFFLDAIRSHCFARFSDVSGASRVRTALHGRVWPDERDRKPLWVDFIPEDKVEEWIRAEQESESKYRGRVRWEVTYEKTDDCVVAELRESRGPGTRPSGRPEPRGDVKNAARRASPKGESSRPRTVEQGFKALDELFLSTKTKPKLYYLPVSREVAEQRLAQFAKLARGRARRRGGGGDDLRRITFEDGDVFVDGGPEYSRPPPNRAGRRGGRNRR